jgi:hypothetical protein
MYAVQGRALTNPLAEKARTLFRNDAEITTRYHKLAAGMESYDGSDAYRLYLLATADSNAMPAVKEIKIPSQSEMGVAVEGSEESWPSSKKMPVFRSLILMSAPPPFF